jgi:PAP2 superfamily C-terminal
MQTAPLPPSPSQPLSWAAAWQRPAFRIKFISGWVLVIAMLTTFHIFFAYIEKREGVVLYDWLLGQLPAYNVSLPVFLFIWGATLLAIVRSVKAPEICLLMIWTYLLVSAARVIAIWLVPLNPSPHLIPLVDPLTNFFYGKQYITKDLFFSGHTSSVFIIFLCLPRHRDKIFTLFSIVCIALLLLVQHVHYTIDILAAPIMSYVCYRLALLIVYPPAQNASPS